MGEATITVGSVIEVASEDDNEATQDGVALGLLQALWQTSTGGKLELHLADDQVLVWCPPAQVGQLLAATMIPIASGPLQGLRQASAGQPPALAAAVSDAAPILTRDKHS